MAIDFSKWDKSADLDGLKNDVAEAATNDGGNFKEVPLGKYEVEVTKLELGESKKHDPMFICWMKILEGEYKGQMIFMNQVVTQGFQIHIVNQFVRDMVEDMGIDVTFESYSQYAEMLMEIAEQIDGKKEFLVDYNERKGFNTFKIEEVYDVE